MIGYVSLLLALIAAEVTVLLYINGIYRKENRLFSLGRKGVWTICGLLTISSMWLLYLLLSRDFQTTYVATYTSRDLPLLYTIAAFWAGSEGSLLFWAWLLSIFTVAVVMIRKENDELTSYVAPTLTLVTSFFLIVLLFASDPFAKLNYMPLDGQGMNPLLQDPGMILHPPTLFLGYAGVTVPFAFAIAGLLTENERWVYRVRTWTLSSWIFLSVGIGLGGWWSYHVLGWGGYWAWDPVENASLMPWLLSTAFLHSVMIQEGKRGMKVWNILLISLTFSLVLYATFLTRSGIIQSVHTFARSPIGYYFLGFILVILATTLGLILIKRGFLKSRNIFEAYLSKETAFLFNNLIFVVLTALVFYGTTFPLVSEAIRGYQASIRSGYFNETFVPLALVLIVLMGVCPLIAWRKASGASLRRNFTHPLALTVIALVIGFFLGITDLEGIITSGVGVFAVSSIGVEFYRGAKAEGNVGRWKRLRNLGSAIRRNRRKYGGYIVHLSIILLAIGIAGSTLYEDTMSFSLSEGESFNTGSHEVKLMQINTYTDSDKVITSTWLEISQNDRKICDAYPSMTYYHAQGQWIRNVHIHTMWFDDIYTIFVGVENDKASLTFKTIPLMNLVWFGIVVLVGGTIVALWPKREK